MSRENNYRAFEFQDEVQPKVMDERLNMGRAERCEIPAHRGC
jgi:hypothetical protein